MRGKIVRMRTKRIKELLENQEELGGTFDMTIGDKAFLFNERVRQVFEREGPY